MVDVVVGVVVDVLVDDAGSVVSGVDVVSGGGGVSVVDVVDVVPSGCATAAVVVVVVVVDDVELVSGSAALGSIVT